MTKTRLEKIEHIQAEIQRLKNREKQLLQQYKEQERKERTHRLIERGGLLESLLHGIESLSNEDIKAVLTAALNSEDARETLAFVQKRKVAAMPDSSANQEGIAIEEASARETRIIRAQQSFREDGA